MSRKLIQSLKGRKIVRVELNHRGNYAFHLDNGKQFMVMTDSIYDEEGMLFIYNSKTPTEKPVR